ncbi:MAG: hypothetical protein ABL907_19380 [Hyphomicrobium sp.]
MNAATLKASLLKLAADISYWCIWWAKLVICIGCAYVAARYFSLGWLSLEGIRIPYPRVSAEPLQLLYIAGCLYAIK